jgi:hypothetical protein
MDMRRLLMLSLVACRPSAGPAASDNEPGAGSSAPARAPSIEPDFTQAERVLEVLSAQGPPTAAQLDAVMATAGTQLILKQLNNSGKVTAEQYRAVLAAASAETAPAIEPADDGEPAAHGVRSLRSAVWPALHWGTEHAGLLAERLAASRTLDLEGAGRTAREWLPERTAAPVRLRVLMGGMSGSPIAPEIFFDVVTISFRESIGMMKYPSPHWAVVMLANQAHHVGLAPIIARTRAAIALRDDETRAFDLLAKLVTKGSAVYFINGERDLGKLLREPSYARTLSDPERLLAKIEQLVGDALDHGADDQRDEDARTMTMLSSIASGGALMFDAIYRVGRPRADAVMRDPRQLLVEYNAAAAALEGRGDHRRRIDAALAARAAQIGGQGPRAKP